MNNPNLYLDPPASSSSMGNNNDNVEEDPTTPKTIHMTRNPFTSTASSNTNSTNNTNLNNNNNNDASNNPSLYLENNDFPSNSNSNNIDVIHNNNSMNGPPQLSLPATASDDGSTPGTTPTPSTSTTRYQRSIPVHRRINNNHHQSHHYQNNNNNTHHGGFMSVTSSTRSVKSVGSSIIDTEDDDKSQQTGLLSLMSQDYVVESRGMSGMGVSGGMSGGGSMSVSGGMSTNASIVESVKSSDVPRIVPKGNGNDGDEDDNTIDELETDEEDNDQDDNDDDDVDVDVDNTNEHNHHNRTRSGVKMGRNSSSNSSGAGAGSSSMGFTMTATIMEKYFRQMQMNLERGLRDIKEQNRRDHDRVMATLQNESNRRTALEGRLHAQILLQSETLIAMEVKLLKLEAKVEKREAALRRKNGPSVNFYGESGSISGGISGGIGSGGERRIGSGSITSIDRNMISTSGLGGQTSFGLENGTIEEEDVFDMTEIRVNNNESHSRFLRGSSNTSGGGGSSGGGGVRIGSGGGGGVGGGSGGVGVSTNPTNIAVISSGASLASGVTATSFLDGLEAHDEHTQEGDDAASGRSGDGDVEDEGDNVEEHTHDGSTSTPTQGSRSHFTNIESILLNPIQGSASSEHALSTRAVRGEYDGNSSLATSVTNTTVASTIITATTGGGGVDIANSTSVSQRGEDMDSMLGLSPPTATEIRPSRSRSQSPLTVHSAATASVGPQSAASVGTVGTSIISTAAVAPARSFRARRDAAARMGNIVIGDGGGRQITNRVVSFTANEVLSLPPEISEAGDSITMPDELDNLSDVADALADRGRMWRDEYEARLDAIQKRFNGE